MAIYVSDVPTDVKSVAMLSSVGYHKNDDDDDDVRVLKRHAAKELAHIVVVVRLVINLLKESNFSRKESD